MNKKRLRIIVLVIILLFLISAIPYFKPKEISNENQKNIEDNLDNLKETDDKATLIDTPEDAFKIRLAMIQSAEKQIDISTYIIHEGKTTDQIFNELLKAADRGVKVRVISDGKLGGMNKDFGKALSNYPGMEIFLYNPFSLFEISSWQTVHHEKHMTVDGKHLLVGGRNFGDKYFSKDTQEFKTVNDYDVFITGDSTATEMHDYVDSFVMHEETLKVHARASNKQTKIIDHLKNNNVSTQDLNDYISKTHEVDALGFMSNNIGVKNTEPKIAYGLNYLSKETQADLILQTPYLSAHPQVLKKVQEAKERGVEVTLLTNSIASSSNYPAYSNYYKNKDKFIETGINIYEFQSDGYRSQHGKAYIFDDLLAVGSVNLDDRSFFINTESMIFVKSEELKKEFQASLKRKIKKSYRVAGDGIEGGIAKPYEVSKTKETLMYIASIFSRLFSFLV